MPTQLHAANAKDGLTVKAECRDSSVLPGLNLEDHLTEHRVLFPSIASVRTKPAPLVNRVSFRTAFTSATFANNNNLFDVTKAGPKFSYLCIFAAKRPGPYEFF